MRLLICLIATATFAASASYATTITFKPINMSGDEWRYDYTVTNNSLLVDVEEFTIFFDLTLFENLSVTNSPVGWDSFVAQPDVNLPDDGFFDSLALSGGLAPNASLGGFSVQFSWLGQGMPGTQPFDVVDPTSFGTLETGMTVAVPEPTTHALFALGMLVVVMAIRRRGLTAE